MGWIKDVYDITADLLSRWAKRKKKKCAQAKQSTAEKAKAIGNPSEEIAHMDKRTLPKRPNWVMDWKRWK